MIHKTAVLVRRREARPIKGWGSAAAIMALLVLTACGSNKKDAAVEAQGTAKAEQPLVDVNGTVQLPERTLPYSALASEEAKKNFIDFTLRFASQGSNFGSGDINSMRKLLDDKLMRPGVDRLRSVFPVTITPEMIGGVQTDVVAPEGGIPTKNNMRVLINLHGGGFVVAARYGGQQESIPIASLGKIKVITVDYREAPEYKFPAASEDVATVYKELLKQYRPENIGIYGCSAGGTLTAQSVAWFQTHGLPRPGAVGIFAASGVLGEAGDSLLYGRARPKTMRTKLMRKRNPIISGTRT
jgi:acetyl esterase/lipase